MMWRDLGPGTVDFGDGPVQVSSIRACPICQLCPDTAASPAAYGVHFPIGNAIVACVQCTAWLRSEHPEPGLLPGDGPDRYWDLQ